MNDTKKDRRKVSQACENCRRKKTKCSGEKPKCKKCARLNVECIYKTDTKKRGPKIGYLDNIINKGIQEKLENLVTNNQIPLEKINKLAKNNSQIFSSSEILRKYIKNDRQDNDIHMTEIDEKCIDPIIQKLSILNNNEYIIFKVPEESETTVGKAVIYNKKEFYNYSYIEVDYSLVKLYFRYAHYYMNILIEDIVIERIQNKTISPGLLLAIYAAAYMYKPNPDFNKSKKYAKLSYYSFANNYYIPNLQMTQAFMIVSNCFSGTSFSWSLVGTSMIYSHILSLVKDINTLSEKYNKERKITFWYSFNKDILFSIITGRSYRYDITNTESAIDFINNSKVTYNSIMFVMNMILVKLMYNIKQYIGEFIYDSDEKYSLEEKLKYWLNVLEPEFNYEYDEKKEELGHIVYFNQLNIFFCTLNILFYRHQSTSFVTNSSKKIHVKALNTPEGIGYNFTKYEREEKKQKQKEFFTCSLNFIRRKKELKIKKESEKTDSFYDGYYNNNNNCNIRMDKKTKGIPNIFSFGNFIYIKEKKARSFKIDYTLKMTKNRDNMNNYECNKISNSYEVTSGNENLKRSLDQSSLNDDEKYLNIKRNRIMSSKEGILSNSNRLGNLDDILIDNDSKITLHNIQDIIKDNENDENNNEYNKYDNGIDNSNDYDYDGDDDNEENEDDDEEKEYYEDNEFNGDYDYDNNSNENDGMNDYNYIKNYIDNNFNEYNGNKSDHSDELLDHILNPFNNSKPSNLIEKYFDLKDNNFSEMESMQENPMNSLKQCLSFANIVTKKVKKMMNTLNQHKMIYNFLIAWCFYEIGIIYLIFYVDEGKSEYLENAKYYRDLLIETSKAYLSVTPYLSKYNEMMQEAEDSVNNNKKKLVIKDIF